MHSAKAEAVAFVERFRCALSAHRAGHKFDPGCEIATNEDMLEALELIDDLSHAAVSTPHAPAIAEGSPLLVRQRMDVLNHVPTAQLTHNTAPSLRVTEDRVLIRADREDHAPTQTNGGIYLATSLAAAVDGRDEAESWFTGTVVQIGPLVNKRDCRKTLVKWLLEIEEEGLDVPIAEIMRLRQKVEEMWTDMPDPIGVGQRVTFSWAAGQQITVDGEKYIILRAGDVLGVLED